MKVTNKYGIPEQIARVLRPRQQHFKEKHLSVSDLISPPLIYHLKRKYYDEISVDLSERLWAMLGTSVHLMLETGSKLADDELNEETLTLNINGWEIVGRLDAFVNNKVIDYKTVSVTSFSMGDKIEWERQLNVYAYMLRCLNYEVKELWIYAILRDWMKSKTLRDPKYPKMPFLQKRIKLWNLDDEEEYITNKLKEFNDEPRICTDKERWVYGGKYALMRKNRKTAVKLYNKVEDVPELSPNEYIEKRPVVYNRCKSYCPVRKVCPFNPYRLEKENVK